ncbi:MAG: glycosyltransferase family 2 protein [Chloroflexi bacterium]|nr:glycosyltransferase family 2 protein [Chloroflexota bacterium]
MIDLPVIIVSYNTRDLLRDCLRAVIASEGVNPLPIVVDNASRDGSAEMVRAEFPGVQLIEAGANLGFAAGNNVALRSLGFGGQQSGAPEFVLLLNPDTHVQPDAIATLLAFIQAHPRAGMVGAQLTYPDGRFQHSAFRFPGIFQTYFDFFPAQHRVMNSALNGRYARHAEPFLVDHPLGASMLLRGAAIQDAGLMDEGYFMYVEEVDWSRRIRAARWDIWCEPRAGIVHFEGQSTSQFRQAMYVQLWKSRLRYFGKFESRARLATIRFVIRLGLWHAQRTTEADTQMNQAERSARLSAIADVRAMLAGNS